MGCKGSRGLPDKHNRSCFYTKKAEIDHIHGTDINKSKALRRKSLENYGLIVLDLQYHYNFIKYI